MTQRVINGEQYEVFLVAGNASGERIPVDIGASSVSITGPVTVSNEVEIKNDSGNPVPVAPNVQQGGGAVTASTTRVTLATDGPGVAALTSIDTKTPALVSNRVPVDGSGVTQPVSGTVTAVGLQVITTATFTRPSDTTAYAAQDVVSDSTSAPTILTFSSAARANGGSGMILSARHLKNSTTTTGATYRLHLYTSAPSAINDNSPFTLLYANRTIRIGFIDFSHTTGGSGSDSTNALTTFVNLPFVCDAASTSLFGILTVTSAYTPTSAEQHFIELQIARN